MRYDVIDFHCLVADWPALRDRLVQRNWLALDPATGEYHAKHGMYLVHLGPKVLTPGVYDENGTEITPPVLDTVTRVYLRLYGDNRLAEEIAPRVDGDGNPVSVLYWTRLGGEIRSAGTWDAARQGFGIRLQGSTRFWVLDETAIVPDHEWQ